MCKLMYTHTHTHTHTHTNLPLVSKGVLVLLMILLGAKSREMSLNGSTVVDTALKERKHTHRHAIYTQ